MRRAILLVVLATSCAGCAETTTLIRRGTDPARDRKDRIDDLEDALDRREPGTAQDLVTRAETLLATRDPDDQACALDTLRVLVKRGEKTAAPLSVRLADPDTPLAASRPALEVLATHPSRVVADLARGRLARLKR